MVAWEFVLAYLTIFLGLLAGMVVLFYRSLQTRRGIQALAEALECLPPPEGIAENFGKSNDSPWLRQLRSMLMDCPVASDALRQCVFYHEQLNRHYSLYFESTLLLMLKLLAYPTAAGGIALVLQYVFPRQVSGALQNVESSLWQPMALIIACCLGSFAMLLRMPQNQQLGVLLQPQNLVSLYSIHLDADSSLLQDEMPDCLRLLALAGFPKTSLWTKIKEAYFQGTPTTGLIEQQAGNAVDHLLKMTKHQNRLLLAWAPFCEGVIGLLVAAWIFLARL